MSGNLFTGAGYFLRGLTMLSEPGLRRFVIVPLMANIMLFSLMGWLLYELISDFYDAALLTVPEWLGSLLDHHAATLVGRRTDDRLCLHLFCPLADLTVSCLAG